MAYWRVEAWWPLSKGIDTSEVKIIVGRELSDSGAGFGQRDVGWHFDNQIDADKAYDALTKHKYQCQITEYDDDDNVVNHRGRS